MSSQTFRQILSPRTDHSGDANNLAFVEREGHIGKAAALRKALSLQHRNGRGSGLSSLPVIFMMELPSNHLLVKSLDCGALRGGFEDDLAVAHDVDTVRDRQNLLKAMRNEHDRGPLLEIVDDPKQEINLLFFQHRGGFVQEDRHITF